MGIYGAFVVFAWAVVTATALIARGFVPRAHASLSFKYYVQSSCVLGISQLVLGVIVPYYGY
jgi:hypothetical protein